MRTATIIALVLLATSADAGITWKPPRVTVDGSALSEQWQDRLQTVLLQWQSCGVLEFRWARKNGQIRVYTRDLGENADAGGFSLSPDRQRRWWESAIVWINTYWTDTSWAGRETKLLCHEFGHALGVGHAPDAGSCMVVGAYGNGPGESGCTALRDLYAR